jgi:hypothetical protein
MIDNWFEQASLLRVDNPAHEDFDRLFEFVEDRGGTVEVLRPAYVDALNGRLVRPGRARRLPRRQLQANGGAA